MTAPAHLTLISGGQSESRPPKPVERGLGVPPGIRRRHVSGCPAEISDDMSVCRCPRGWPHYQAQAGRRAERQTKTLPTLGAAKAWKRDIEQAVARGEQLGERAPRLRDAAASWLAAAEAGAVMARGNRPYKPSTLRAYRRCLALEVLPILGDARIDDITRKTLTEFVMNLSGRRKAAPTIRNIVIPLRAIYRHAIDLEQISWGANPTRGLRVPGGSGRRERVVAPAHISPLLAALDPRDRVVWATAIYAGLRRGELMALRWSDVDFDAGLIRVERSYDPGARVMVGPKSKAGRRRVAICAALRDELTEHRERTADMGFELVFAAGSLGGAARGNHKPPAEPFHDDSLRKRATIAWDRAGVPSVGFHDCRHTFVSLMIAAMAAAGTFDPKNLQRMLGHTSMEQTYDRYGHLFPGAEGEMGRMLDAFLKAT